MHECYNNVAFHLHSTIYTAILNIHCFFFPLVYIHTNSPFLGRNTLSPGYGVLSRSLYDMPGLVPHINVLHGFCG